MSTNEKQKTNGTSEIMQEKPVTNETTAVDSVVLDADGQSKDDQTKQNEITATTNNETKKPKKTFILVLSIFAAVVIITGVILLIVINSKSAEAKRVDSLINNIGTVTLKSEKSIAEAEKEAKALSKEDYDQLDNIETLKEARKKYKEIEEEARKKHEEIEEASYVAESSNTVFLIKDIGTVTENSEKKIKKAEDAYEKLSSKAKEKVTNYSVLKKARAEFSKIKLNSILSKLKKDEDSVTGITFYYPKVTINEDHEYFQPYIGKNNKEMWLCLDTIFFDEFVYFNKMIINADGKITYRNCSSEGIECLDTYFSDTPTSYKVRYNTYNTASDDDLSDLQWLNDIANSKKAVIRFLGAHDSHDFTIPDSDKAEIKKIVDAFTSYWDNKK